LKEKVFSPGESQRTLTSKQDRLLNDLVVATNHETSRVDLRVEPYVVVKVDKIVHNHLCRADGLEEDDLGKTISVYEEIYSNSGWRIQPSDDDASVYSLSPTEYRERIERRRLDRIKRNSESDYRLLVIVLFPISIPVLILRSIWTTWNMRRDTELEKENRFNALLFPFIVLLVIILCGAMFYPFMG